MNNFETKAHNRAHRDLEEKLRLEAIFAREIKSLFAQMRDDFKVRVAAEGVPPNGADYTNAWESALKKHYNRVQKAFSGSVLEFNGKSFTALEYKQEEEEETQADLLALALLNWRNSQSVQQARFIVQTNNTQMRSAISKATQILSEQGELLAPRNIAATASNILTQSLAGRVENIITLETQSAAESTKIFEARTMAGLKPEPTIVDVILPEEPTERLKKEWQTVGDRVVRPTHKAANRQVVDINSPFIVGGFELMYPSDSSLGAPLRETMGCRCSSLYFTE